MGRRFVANRSRRRPAQHPVPRATISQPSRWGSLEDAFGQLDEVLSTAFDMTNIQRHLAKLSGTQAASVIFSSWWVCTTSTSRCSRPWLPVRGCPPMRLHCQIA
jgi:hypothetical protein